MSQPPFVVDHGGVELAQPVVEVPLVAEVYERLGRRADAAAAWTRFADRWSAADPVLQGRVAGARAEAERLRKSGRGQ